MSFHFLLPFSSPPIKGSLRVIIGDKFARQIISFFGAMLIAIFILEKLFPNCTCFQYIKIVLIMALSTLIFIIIQKTDIVFSSRQSEGKNELKPFQLVNILYRDILNSKYENSNSPDYYVVIEDLDRVEKYELVIRLIQEVKRYYVENINTPIVFIFNIKKESQIKEGENKKLYNKLFDYILELPEIDNQNYDNVLFNLLKDEMEKPNSLIKNISEEELEKIVWLNIGEDVDLRKIKDRLNRTFSLYYFLIKKYEMKNIDFKKCIGAVYLKTEFEEEMNNYNGEKFEELINKIIFKPKEEQTTDFEKSILELVKANMIDINSMIYYYNFPNNYVYFKYYEQNVSKAIVENIDCEKLNEYIEQCVLNDDRVFIYSFNKIKQMGIGLNDIVVNNDILLAKAIKYNFDEYINYLDSILIEEIDTENENKILRFIKIFYKTEKQDIKQINKIIESLLKSKSLINNMLNIRLRLNDINNLNILDYIKIFENPYPVISKKEIDIIQIDTILKLIKNRQSDISSEIIEYIIEKIEKLSLVLKSNTYENLKHLIDFRIKVESYNFDEKILLKFMKCSKRLVPEYENMIEKLCIENDEMNYIYQVIINSLDNDSINDSTLEHISNIGKYSGYSANLIELFEKKGDIFSSSMLKILHNIDVDIFEEEIKKNIIDQIKCISDRDANLLVLLRHKVIDYITDIKDYEFVFDNNLHILDEYVASKIVKKFGLYELLIHLNFNELSQSNYTYIIKIINSVNPSGKDVFNVMTSFEKWPNELMKDAITDLDFNIYKLSLLTIEERKNIIGILKSKFFLKEPKDYLNYCFKTMYIDESFDLTVLESINKKLINENQYIDLINTVCTESISDNTINNISCLDYKEFNANIEDILLQKEKFDYYIASISLKNNDLKYDRELFSKHKEEYVKLFSTKNEKIKRLLENKDELLVQIINNKLYKDMSDSALLILSKAKQDAEIVTFISNNKKNITKKYFLLINEFTNQSVRRKVINCIRENESLRYDNELIEKYPELQGK